MDYMEHINKIKLQSISAAWMAHRRTRWNGGETQAPPLSGLSSPVRRTVWLAWKWILKSTNKIRIKCWNNAGLV